MPNALKPDGYLPRIVDAQVERYLRIFGAVEIAGTKWCGKTWTSSAHAASSVLVDDVRALAAADPSTILLGERPRVIDEWQLEPRIWDAVRREVDRTADTRGAFILTGSSTPLPKSQGPSHSGAGRIGRIRMHPMTLAESGESSGCVSLAGLFEGRFEPCTAEKDTSGLVELACRGGWPEALGLSAADAQILARSYLDLTFTESVPLHGRNSDTARRMLASVARTLGQSATYATLAAGMYADEDTQELGIGADTARAYLDLFSSMYLTEEIPGWVPPARSRKRVATKAKRYLADPSLACAALGLGTDALLADWQTFGLVFENMAIRDLTVYARAHELASPVPLRYYRDDSGLEADAILELADGRWAPIEIKTSEDKVPAAIKSLKRLHAKLTANPKARTRPPAFMAVLTGNGEYARQAEPGLFVIPLRTLGP